MDLVFLAPDPGPPGGGAAFNAGMIPALRALGHRVEVGGAAVPGALPVIDGIALPALEPEFDALLAADAIVIVHHVSAAAGQDRTAREAVRAAEGRMLQRVRRVVATSQPVADRLSALFGVTAAVLTPGVADLPRTAQAPDGPCRIFSPGVLTRRKGHDRLLHALAGLVDLEWTLTIAGDAERDPVQAGTIAALIEELGLSARTRLLADPSVEALEPEWAAADLFALGSEWEGWPQGAAEALRRGIPVVAFKAGGLAGLVPAEAGVLVEPGESREDLVTFGKVLRRAIFDRRLRSELADGAWQAGLTLPSWPQQALAFDTILRS